MDKKQTNNSTPIASSNDTKLDKAIKGMIKPKRAKRGEGAILKHSICFRLSDNEKHLIKDLTNQYGMSQTDFLRLSIVQTATRIREAVKSRPMSARKQLALDLLGDMVNDVQNDIPLSTVD